MHIHQRKCFLSGGMVGVSASKRITAEQMASIADSIAKVELLLFFHSNPMAVDSAKGLSIWLGRDPRVVEEAANELVDAMVLTRYGEGEEAVYTLANDSEIIGALEEFVSTTLSRKEMRDAFLRQILCKEAKGR